MNELRKYIDKIKEYWRSRSKKQKIQLVSMIAGTILFVSVITFFLTRTEMAPLYSNLSPSETGAIKENLDQRGVKSEIADGGTTILVPKEKVDQLKVELAAEGIPDSGSIDYSFFSEKTGIGMTENEFNLLKLEAMQTELANLIKEIDGIKDAKVMITLPEKSVFVTEGEETASASIVLQTEPGYKFSDKQIRALYHLVSKSVPNLPKENIAIMNQNFEYLEMEDTGDYTGNSFASQNAIKRQIEKDIQREVQNFLGLLMGHDKVAVLVTTDIDFTQENREEHMVLPVDEENMEGITISAQKITEAYSGAAAAEGSPAAEDPADSLGTSYYEGGNGEGEYERIEETVNKEVNKIRKEIKESPYKIRDLGIQVVVEPPVADDPLSLPQERVEDIRNVLEAVVRTSIDKEAGGELTEESISEKISVSVQPFAGKIDFEEVEEGKFPLWIWIIAGVLLLSAVAFLLALMVFRRRRATLVGEMEAVVTEKPEMPDIAETQKEEPVSESFRRRRQLEQLAQEKPQEFVKLLRSWMAED